MDQITLSLTRAQFDYVINVLAQRPYGEVAQLMNELARQRQENEPVKEQHAA